MKFEKKKQWGQEDSNYSSETQLKWYLVFFQLSYCPFQIIKEKNLYSNHKTFLKLAEPKLKP